MKKALIVTYEGYKDYEAIYPYYRLLEDGFEVDVMANCTGKVKGVLGSSIPSNLLLEDLDDEAKFIDILDRYDILIIPGGVNSLEKLRLVKSAVKLVKEWNVKGKIIGSMCTAAQMLISAGIVKGRKISGYYSIQDDITNSGAIFVDEPAVTDENIITSPHYKWVGNWMKEILRVYYLKA
jgi:protease I